MGLLDLFRRPATVAAAPSRPQADAGTMFYSLDDPRLFEFMRDGVTTASGAAVSVRTALCNTAVFRSVSLIAYSIGMLPLQLINEATKEKADGHPLYALLHREPNNWQTAFDFRSLMQLRALVKGNAYARIIRSRGNVLRLVPIDPDHIKPVQNADWSVSYRYTAPSAAAVMLAPEEVFHLRGLTLDGINGISLVQQAREAIGLALAADHAIGRVFKNGSFVDGVLQTDKTLGQEAFDRLRDSWAARYSGADNAGKTPLLEEGVKYSLLGSSAKDAQFNETRARQVEEIARVFGVPRPLLMVDETSWGSGVEALGRFFVQYGLAPWFEAWQQAIERSLLVGPEKAQYSAKFNAGSLLRGDMAAQGVYFAQALGAGGHAPWMTPNEVRDLMDLPRHADGDSLTSTMMGHNGGPPLDDGQNNG